LELLPLTLLLMRRGSPCSLLYLVLPLVLLLSHHRLLLLTLLPQSMLPPPLWRLIMQCTT
jgi:hypothetical protein